MRAFAGARAAPEACSTYLPAVRHPPARSGFSPARRPSRAPSAPSLSRSRVSARAMNPGAYAGKRVDDALARDTTWVPAFETRPPTAREPSPVPSPAKKRAYWMWFAAILCLETAMIRRSTKTLHPGSTGAVKNSFLLHTQALNIAVHLVVDLSALRSLNALHPRWGVWFPETHRGFPALRFSEERAVVIRHFFKLFIRTPVVNCVLLGGKLDGFHAYQVKQLLMMVLSPTFFAALFAVKSIRSLTALALINACFVAACAVSVPFAYKYAPDLRAAFWDTLGPTDDLPRRFAQIAVALAAAPFASRLAVWIFHLDAAPPSPVRALAAIHEGRVPKSVEGPLGMKNQNQNQNQNQKQKGYGGDGGALDRAAALGGAWLGVDDAARHAADVDEPAVELSASALCFYGSAPQCVTVRGVPPGVSLRVTFDGHVLRTSSEFIRDAESGAVHTLLRVWPPEPETGAPGKSASGDVDRPSLPPFGRAWVSSGYVRENAVGVSSRNGSKRAEARETTFETTGAALALLFLLDPETVREVNNAVMLIQHNMNSVLANRLVMRMGNCITRATYNVNDYQVMTEVTGTMGMVRCERMLRAFYARVAGEANAAELSQAGTSSRGAAAKGTQRGRRAARGTESPEESDSGDADAVDGPEEAAGGDAPRARRGGGVETAAVAGGDGSSPGALRRRTRRRP